MYLLVCDDSYLQIIFVLIRSRALRNLHTLTHSFPTRRSSDLWQFKLNGAHGGAMFDWTPIFYTKTTAPASGTSSYTVSTLPASPANGDRAYVTDARACTFMATPIGGGGALCPVIYLNGWKAGG